MCLTVFGLAAFALAQGAFRYTDTGGSLSVTAKSALFTQAAGPIYKFTLRSNVTIDDKSQGLKMFAQQVTMEAVPKGKATDIRKALATGGLTINKTVRTPWGVRTSVMTGSKGDYRKRGSDGLVNLTGPVTITNLDSAKRQSMIATGSSAQAILEPSGSAKKSGLRTATLSGNVKVTIVQAAVGKEKGGTMVATGNRMVLNNMGTPATLTLSGNVNMDGRGPGSFGTMRGISKAVMTLNDDGEWTSFSTEGG
jgi:hypothetical protein